MTRPALLVVLFLFSIATAQDQPAQPPRTPTAIEFNTVPREVIEKRLVQAGGKNEERQAALEQIFREAGCDGDRLRQQVVKGSKLRNVICTMPGSTDSIIIVGGHFGAVEGSPGVVDNWSGAALLPSFFQSLSGQNRAHTFVFIGFGDEAKGIAGSEFYASQLTTEQMVKVKTMITLDSLGLSPTKVWMSRSDRDLANSLNSVASAMKLPLSAMETDHVGGSDGDSFSKRNIPTITIHSVTAEAFPIVRSTRDQLAAVNMDEYFASYRLLAAYLAFLDSRLDTNPRVLPKRIRLSEDASQGNLIDSVMPLYPGEAKMGRIQGAVVLRMLIGKDGKVKQVDVVSGHPLLVPAARDAVLRWRYRPYVLNGEPVEVETQVTVNFTLAP